MSRPKMAVELVLLFFGLLPLGVASTVFWFTTSKVPHWLIYALIAVFTGCVIAGIEERFEKSKEKKDLA